MPNPKPRPRNRFALAQQRFGWFAFKPRVPGVPIDATLQHIHRACVGPRYPLVHDAFVAQLIEIRELPEPGLTTG